MFKKDRINNRSNGQVQLLEELEELWLEAPSLRFTQLIENITGCGCNYYMTDEKFLQLLRKLKSTPYKHYETKNTNIY